MINRNDFIGKAYIGNNTEDFSVGHWIADVPGNEIKPHGHPNAHVMFITSGNFATDAMGAPEKKLSLMVYNPPDTFHQDHFKSDTGSFFTISIPAKLIEDAYEIKLPKDPTIVSNPVSETIVSKLMRICVGQHKDSLSIIESLCFEMLGAIANTSIERYPPKWLRYITEILQDCYSEELSIKNISQQIGIHPVYLTRAFNAFYSCTPGEFLRIYRVKKATELLISTRLPLVDVAMQSGFFDQSHLTKHFRRTFGVAPGKFRKLSNRAFLHQSKVYFIQ